MDARKLLLFLLLALAASALADRACPKCHQRWPDEYILCPIDAVSTRPARGGAEVKRPVDPKVAAAFNGAFGWGLHNSKIKAYGKAARAFAKAVALRPDSSPAIYNQARTLFLIGGKDNEAAARVLVRRAIALDPGYGDPHNTLGSLLAQDGDRDGAEREYRKAMALDPKYSRPHHNLGALLAGEDRFAAAEQEFRKAIALDPNDPFPRTGLGILLWQRHKDYAGAEGQFRQALRLDPKHTRAATNLRAMLKEKSLPPPSMR